MNNSGNKDDWIPIAEATSEFSISERTLWRRIQKGTIKSRKEGRHRLVSREAVAESVQTQQSPTGDLSVIEQRRQLRMDINYLRTENNELRAQLRDESDKADAAKQRSDTIILQLTRQMEQAQLALEAHREPFWKRWFRKGQT